MVGMNTWRIEPSLFFQKGMQISTKSFNAPAPNKTYIKKFRSNFGVSPGVCSAENVLGPPMVGADSKTFWNHVWPMVELIAGLKPIVVSLL